LWTRRKAGHLKGALTALYLSLTIGAAFQAVTATGSGAVSRIHTCACNHDQTEHWRMAQGDQRGREVQPLQGQKVLVCYPFQRLCAG
jgi:hypothetical protein